MPKLSTTAPLLALLLSCTALSSSAHAGWFDSSPAKSDSDKTKKADAVKAALTAPAADLDSSVRQAQLLRLDGQYPEAIKHLSQLMIVASDDSRVVSEYGKTLAAMGRAQEAVNFLSRAQQLSPGDWSVYSALGVAYDQMNNPRDAQAAYEHALALKPDEPSVLNNYALSRMLAKDPDTAARLMARAEAAGGASDPKIARNIGLLKDMTPGASAFAVAQPKPAQQAKMEAPQAAPRMPVTVQTMPKTAPSLAQAAPPAPKPMSSVAQPAPSHAGPASLAVAQATSAPTHAVQNTPAPTPAPASASTSASTGAPRVLMPQGVTSTAMNTAAKPGAVQTQPMTAQAKPTGVIMQKVPFDPLAGPVAVHSKAEPAPRKLAKTEKPDAAPTPKTADKSEMTQKVLAAIDKQAATKAPAKVADAKPVPAPAPVKVTAKTEANNKMAKKDTIPGLRLSANAY